MNLEERNAEGEVYIEKELQNLKYFNLKNRDLVIGFTLSGMVIEFVEGKVDWKFNLDTSILDIFAEYVESKGRSYQTK